MKWNGPFPIEHDIYNMLKDPFFLQCQLYLTATFVKDGPPLEIMESSNVSAVHSFWINLQLLQGKFGRIFSDICPSTNLFTLSCDGTAHIITRFCVVMACSTAAKGGFPNLGSSLHVSTSAYVLVNFVLLCELKEVFPHKK